MLKFLLSLRVVQRVFAQESGGGPPQSSTISLPNLFATCSDLSCLATKIFNGLLIVAVPVTTFFVLIAAFQMLTAGGDEEKFKKGKKTLLYAVVGFAVVLIGTIITNLISDILGGGLSAITGGS